MMLFNVRTWLVAGAVLLVTGCATMNQNGATPDADRVVPVTNPDGTVTYVNQPKEMSAFRLSDPEPPAIDDKELENIPPEMQSKVQLWVAYFQGKGRGHMERYLGRSSRYIQLMKRIMRENGLPEDLVYIALIESGFSSRATSRAAAVGYWQFIKGTGRRYGLEINSFVDERRDPVLSTQAAAEYFKGLYSVFGSWYLSMASYNVGENRVKRELVKSYTKDFWELAHKRRLPKETANYVPKFVAARMIAKNPEKYGFSDVDYDKPQEFELISVDKSVNLKTMAEKMGMDYEDFKILNPKFRGEIAPLKKDSALELRVPVGQTQVALAAAAQSVVDKVEFIADAGETETYKVRSGDSLFTIARRYHTTVAYLRDVNDIKAGKRLRIGMRIQVPEKGSGHGKSKSVAKAKAEPKPAKPVDVAAQVATEKKSTDDSETASGSAEITTDKGVYYIVQQGDTLSSISEEYDSSIKELRKMNNLGKHSLIKVGMKLRVPKDEGLPSDPDVAGMSTNLASTPAGAAAALAAPSPALNMTPAASSSAGQSLSSSSAGSSESISHKVKAGENLTVIAKQYGVTVKEIRDANKLKKKSVLSEGMTLVIPVKVKPSSSVNLNSRKSRASKSASHKAAQKVLHGKVAATKPAAKAAKGVAAQNHKRSLASAHQPSRAEIKKAKRVAKLSDIED